MPELVVPTVAGRGQDRGRHQRALDRARRRDRGIGAPVWRAGSHLPFIDPAADMRLVLDDDGAPVGYADVSGPEDGTPKAWVDLRALAGRPRCGRARSSRWAQERGAERAGAGGEIQFFADERDGDARGAPRQRRLRDRALVLRDGALARRRARARPRGPTASSRGRSTSATRRPFTPPPTRPSATTGATSQRPSKAGARRTSAEAEDDFALARSPGTATRSQGSASTGRARGEDETDRLGRCARRAAPVAPARPREALCSASRFGVFASAGKRARRPRRRRGEHDGRRRALRAGRACTSCAARDTWERTA